MSTQQWHYSGDMDLEHGGLYYSLDTVQWGYYDAVRVIPFSDAGGQDNGFWIEEGAINIPNVTKVEEALRACGLTMTGDISDHELAVALASYGYFEPDQIFSVQIGPDDRLHNGEYIPYTLRLNKGTDLRAWVTRRLT